ncbi:MAG TPA: Ig-like domain-containing protein [Longimicrobiaceae bacterium]|nr:Ig-like domain-containing protein [Longimicrobiaceae bacterium]
MPRSPHRALLLLLCAAAAACGDGATPVSPAGTPRPAPGGPSATIYDGAHAAPQSKFYFLPPMVKNPKVDWTRVDGNLSPVVEVCELTAANACGRLIDRYGPTGGGKTNENVRWLGNHYHVDFHAGAYTLDPSKRLRVTVFVDNLALGWADVIVGTTAKAFHGVDDDEFVTITTSETLPIKFRIGEGIARRITLNPPTRTVKQGQTTTYAASVVDLHGLPLNTTIAWTSSDPTIASVDANGNVTTYRPGTVTITATAGLTSSSGTLTVTAAGNDPCLTTGMALFGSATFLGTCGVRLTPSVNWVTGTAWLTTRQMVANGFESRFSFRMSDPGPADLLVGGNTEPGADGIVFVIQNQSANATGVEGVGIGYAGIASSIAVEFDTWLNGGEQDPNGNHISIHTNGTGPNSTSETYSIGSVTVPGDWYDNQVHQVVVRYVPGTMTVTLDGVTMLTVPVTLTNIGGSSILGADGTAWAGFTAGTGGAYGTHDILSWEMITQ